MKKKPSFGSKPRKKSTTISRNKRKTTFEEDVSREEDNKGVTLGTVADDGGQDEGTALEASKGRKLSKAEIALEKFAQITLQKKMEGLKAEFSSLTSFAPVEVATTAFSQHKDKNRYHNILCYDHSRVVLKYNVPPDTDYIHANWISDSNHIKLGCKYICSQAPTESTTNDFWRMLWQEKPKHIVMLCRTIENGKPKCAQYWPLNVGETKTYGTITVINARTSTPDKETVWESSTLQVSVGAESFEMYLHRWTNWPDFGTPHSGMGMLRLLRIVRESKKALIHCSAGVGRTGTVMAVEVVLRSLLDGNVISPLDVVKDLRSQRQGMIQTEGQYLFLHRTIFEYLSAKKIAKNETAEFMSAYMEATKPQTSAPPVAAIQNGNPPVQTANQPPHHLIVPNPPGSTQLPQNHQPPAS